MPHQRIDPVDFAAIKATVSVEEVLRHLGWTETSREPSSMRGPCPIHGSRSTHSRSLSVAKTWWRCHSCGAKGDVLRLWALIHGSTDLEAAIAICTALHIRIPRRAAR